MLPANTHPKEPRRNDGKDQDSRWTRVESVDQTNRLRQKRRAGVLQKRNRRERRSTTRPFVFRRVVVAKQELPRIMRRWSYQREGPRRHHCSLDEPNKTCFAWTGSSSVVVGGPSCGQRKDGDEFVTEFVDDKDENRDGTRDGRDGVD
jgi:hypothetical protein